MSQAVEDIGREVFLKRSSKSKIYWKRLLMRLKLLSLKKELEDSDKNRIWFIGCFSETTIDYIDTFRNMKNGKFRKSWNALERIEISLLSLNKNLFFPEYYDHLNFLTRIITQWQSTYPYKLFASPEIQYLDWKCSLCGKKSTPVEPCGHRVGRVYAGQMCVRIITEAKLLGVSLVSTPVQKYSVIEPKVDEYTYSVTKYVSESLSDPFQDWTGKWTYTRHPHFEFRSCVPDANCPCGSGLQYGECCLRLNGVILDHFQVEIENLPRPAVRIVGAGRR